MRRYWEVYKILMRNSLIREMSFKANFLLWMVTELLWFAGQIILIDVLFLYTENIAGWSKWEVVALIGTNQIIVQVFQAFFYMNLTTLPDLVRTGRLDLLLLLPLDAQFSVSTRQFGIDNLVNAAVGAGFVSYSLHRLGITPDAVRVVGYVAPVLIGGDGLPAVGPLRGRAVVAALTALVAGRLFWRVALRRYSSASS